MDVNGHRKEIQLAAGNGKALDGQSAEGETQSLAVDVPAKWLKKGLNLIQMGNISGSWAVFDAISFETNAAIKMGSASSSLILSAKAADFEMMQENKKVQPLLINVFQLDKNEIITINIQGQKPITKKVEKGHSILEIPMPALSKGQKEKTVNVTVLSENKIIYSGLAYRSPKPLQTDADYVDLLMGTGNSRWMFKPGPSLPLSMVQIAPDNQDETWKAGYEYTIDNITGFSHFSDWTMCGLLMMPTGGKLQVTPGKENDPDGGYRSRIDKKSEHAQIGKYSVYMTDTRIKADITATRRAALQRYTFPQMDSARIMEKEGNMDVELAPHQQKDITLSLPQVNPQNGEEYYLNVFAFTKAATELVPAAHEIAREQFKYDNGNYFTDQLTVGELKITKEDNRLKFQSGNISGEFDTQNGRILNYGINGKAVLSKYPEPYFWRAPTDNDFGNGKPGNLAYGTFEYESE